MIIGKAIELLTIHAQKRSPHSQPDTIDAIKLGQEALKRIQDIRQHPAHSIYGPLLGESMPERGV